MAILPTDGQINNPAQPQGNPQATATPNQQQTNQTTQQENPARLARGIRQQIGRRYIASIGSEQLVKVGKIFKDTIVEDQLTDINIAVMDRHQGLVDLSGIVLYKTAKSNGRNAVVIHTLVLEEKGVELPNQITQLGNESVEIKTVPSDVYDTAYFEQVKELLRGDKVIFDDAFDAGCTVLRSNFNLEDVSAIRPILSSTFATLDSYTRYVQGNFDHVMSPQVLRNGSTIQARVDFAAAVSEDIQGLPVRADINIQLAEAMPVNTFATSQNGRNRAIRQDVFSEVDGFINFQFVEPQPGSPVPQCFVPEMVVTAISAPELLPSIELVLFTLGSLGLLATNNAWVESFLPRMTLREPLRNIGALNYEAGADGEQMGEKINIHEASFTERSFFKFLQFAVRPSIMYSIDVPEQGDMAWILNELADTSDASAGGAATRRIIKAADRLTNGQFGKIWGQQNPQPIIMPSFNRIPNGYYVDEKQQLNDVRDVDYLALANRAEDPNAVATAATWDESFNNQGILGERERLNIIHEATLGSETITGYSRRVTLNPNFILALASACKNAGLGINAGNVRNYTRGHGRRRIDALLGALADPAKMGANYQFNQSNNIQQRNFRRSNGNTNW